MILADTGVLFGAIDRDELRHADCAEVLDGHAGELLVPVSADDIVAHCDTEDHARRLRSAIAERLGALGLELHPDKTKIVYCKDTNRRWDSEHASFDFLGTPSGVARLVVSEATS